MLVKFKLRKSESGITKIYFLVIINSNLVIKNIDVVFNTKVFFVTEEMAVDGL